MACPLLSYVILHTVGFVLLPLSSPACMHHVCGTDMHKRYAPFRLQVGRDCAHLCVDKDPSFFQILKLYLQKSRTPPPFPAEAAQPNLQMVAYQLCLFL